ncbi:MAG TPA: family 43 glycosylhydrolase, partial [Bacteroidales bacterium]|nr:family 43 glycosylhydrolase [Bacteroidales bacterium]
PFTPQTEPIKNVHGIDPNPFIDKDGQAYLYWASREIFVAKMKDNMVELASDPMVIDNLPQKGLKEGPYLFERNGIYYLTYPHVANKIERLEYAIADNPMGPFKVTGVIMDETPMGTWTNHQSFIKYKGQWYLFYHQSAYSPNFDKSRSACIDSLFFNEDGTIQKVIPTLRGVGLTNASDEIQIDRYSSKSNKGVTDVFLDTLDTFKGWKAVFSSAGAWVQYNAVDFGNRQFNTVSFRAESKTGGKLEVRLGTASGPLVATVQVPAGNDMKIVKAPVSGLKKGVQNLVVVSKNNNPVAVDWVSFE